MKLYAIATIATEKISGDWELCTHLGLAKNGKEAAKRAERSVYRVVGCDCPDDVDCFSTAHVIEWPAKPQDGKCNRYVVTTLAQYKAIDKYWLNVWVTWATSKKQAIGEAEGKLLKDLKIDRNEFEFISSSTNCRPLN